MWVWVPPVIIYRKKNVDSYNRWYFRPQVTLTYTINEVLSARYRYNLRNVNPSLSELSNVEQWIDSLQVRRGNPGLSPFLYHNNAVEFHVNTAKVKAGFTFSYQYQPRMVMEETLYDASRGLLSAPTITNGVSIALRRNSI